MTKAELKQTNAWYESGMAFIDGLRERSKRYAFFKAQFGQAIASGAFEKMTPHDLIEGLKVNGDFWEWWRTACVDCIPGMLIPQHIILSVTYKKKEKYGRHKKSGQCRTAMALGKKTGVVA